MLKLAIPVIHVSSSSTAEAFYCGKLGFRPFFVYRPDAESQDPCYMGLERDNAHIHVSSFSGDGVAGTTVVIHTDNVDELHKELATKGLTFRLQPTDQTWGNREMYLDDPDGNSIRFTQPNSG